MTKAFIYSIDCNEPPHVHIERDNNIAKIWLTPIRVQSTGGFKRSEINRIYRLVEENSDELLGGWNERCSD